jgi:hypothetical protein
MGAGGKQVAREGEISFCVRTIFENVLCAKTLRRNCRLNSKGMKVFEKSYEVRVVTKKHGGKDRLASQVGQFTVNTNDPRPTLTLS